MPNNWLSGAKDLLQRGPAAPITAIPNASPNDPGQMTPISGQPDRNQLLALAQKYFPPEDVDKVLWVIAHESGGDPTAVGDGGVAHGLFQSHYVAPNATVEQQFEEAASLYQADKKAGGTGFGDWGEGRLYQGKPFGSLGNNPYPGGGTDPNWKPNEAQLTDKPGPIRSLSPTKPITTDRLAPSPVQLPKTFSSPVKPYTPAGDYSADLQGYTNQIAAAEAALEKFKAAHPKDVYQLDPNSGIVTKWTNDTSTGVTKWIQVPDPQATAIYAPAVTAANAIDRIATLQKAGLTNSPADAAKAYVASETEHVKSAVAQHADFINRIKDLAAIENIPLDRMQNLATALKSVNDYNDNRKMPWAQTTLYAPTKYSFSDVGPYATQAKANMGTDSAPYSMNPDAWGGLAAAGQNQKVPMPPPTSFISSAGLGAQGVLGGIGAGIQDASSTAYKPGGQSFTPTTTNGLGSTAPAAPSTPTDWQGFGWPWPNLPRAN